MTGSARGSAAGGLPAEPTEDGALPALVDLIPESVPRETAVELARRVLAAEARAEKAEAEVAKVEALIVRYPVTVPSMDLRRAFRSAT